MKMKQTRKSDYSEIFVLGYRLCLRYFYFLFDNNYFNKYSKYVIRNYMFKHQNTFQTDIYFKSLMAIKYFI